MAIITKRGLRRNIGNHAYVDGWGGGVIAYSEGLGLYLDTDRGKRRIRSGDGIGIVSELGIAYFREYKVRL